MTYFYVYLDEQTKGYEIYQSRETNVLGKYLANGREYVFAGFTRLIDASEYVKGLNSKLHR